MFTGIVQTVGRIEERIEHPCGDVSLLVDTAGIRAADIEVGDSICVSGVCLTAIEVTPVGFRTDVSAESLARTTLQALEAGSRVNLEAALTPQTRLGGTWSPAMSTASGSCSHDGRTRDRSGSSSACRRHSPGTSRKRARCPSTAPA